MAAASAGGSSASAGGASASAAGAGSVRTPFRAADSVLIVFLLLLQSDGSISESKWSLNCPHPLRILDEWVRQLSTALDGNEPVMQAVDDIKAVLKKMYPNITVEFAGSVSRNTFDSPVKDVDLYLIYAVDPAQGASARPADRFLESVERVLHSIKPSLSFEFRLQRRQRAIELRGMPASR